MSYSKIAVKAIFKHAKHVLAFHKRYKLVAYHPYLLSRNSDFVVEFEQKR